MKKLKANLVDVFNRKISPSELTIEEGKIVAIECLEEKVDNYIVPGFIDAHVHIESSMLTPRNFGRLTVEHGTIAVVTDPHEIANVGGVKAINFMYENAKGSPIKTFFTIPSCVPATPFDVAGEVVTADDVKTLVDSKRFVGLSEMMNVPGVIMKDPEVLRKLKLAREAGLVIDGHAPLLSGTDLKTYFSEGITTDHECFELSDAQEKLAVGMKILIREGSAARNYNALKSLIATNPKDVLFCTDDSHPDEIVARGHIDKLVRMAIADGFDLFNVLIIASHNAIQHYKLSVGELRLGDAADFVLVDNLKDFNVLETYVDGEKQYDAFMPIYKEDVDPTNLINNFNHDLLLKESLVKAVKNEISVIELVPNQLITKVASYEVFAPTHNLESDIEKDVLKIVYVNRYTNGTPQVAFCRGFGLKRGAFASSVAHDSHNILAIGTNDDDILKAINLIIENKGGLSLSDGETCKSLSLPIGGIMTNKPGHKVAKLYGDLSKSVRAMGCHLDAPYMTLAFMSLVVIPEVKIGEKGLFYYSKFAFAEEK